MALFGLGRAFNLKYRTNGPIQYNCYQRRMPLPMMFGGNRNVSITENYNFQTTPGGLLGGMMGFGEGWFTGGLFASSIMGLFEHLGLSKSKPQGPTDKTENPGEDKYLKSLTQVLGSKGTFSKHPDRDGVYIMTTKDGKVIEDTYQNLIDKFKGEPAAEVKQNPEQKNLESKENENKAANQQQKANDGTPQENNINTRQSDNNNQPVNQSPNNKAPSRTSGAGNSGSTSRSGSKSPTGWYRAAENDGDGKAVLKSIRSGMSARQVTDIILKNKVNYLSEEDRNKLAKDVAQKNPSIFKDGKVKDNFDPSKLDIPSIKYIKENYVGSSKGMRTTKSGGTKQATGEYNGATGKHKIGKTITAKSGRYAKQIDGKWHYFAKDGSELNEAFIRQKDPDLFEKTIAEQQPRMNREGNNTYSVQIKTKKGTRTYRTKAKNAEEAKKILRQMLDKDGYTVNISNKSDTFTVKKR